MSLFLLVEVFIKVSSQSVLVMNLEEHERSYTDEAALLSIRE